MPKQALSYSRLGRSYLEALEGRLLLAGIVSDDFNGASLDTSLWTLVDPVGDSTLSFDGAHALLGVPAGVDHSVWRSGNKSARLMQPAADEDLGVEVKFDSQPSGVYAQQGLIIEQNDGNFLRFDFFSNAQGLNLFAASFVNGSPTKRLNTRVTLGATLYLRVERQGDTWTLRYSDDGEVWRQGVSFTHSLGVTRVGVFAGNEGSSPPAHTAAIDHFRSLADPVPPPPPDENQPPVAWNDSATTLQSQPVIIRVLDNDADPDGTLDPATVTIVTQPANGLLQVDPQTGAVTYAPNTEFIGSDSFIYTVRDDLGLVSNQATVTIDVTAEPAPQQGPTIDMWHGDEQTFGLPGRAQRWVNILGNVQDPDGIASLTYRLNGGPEQFLSIGPDSRRLAGMGDFNVEIDADILQPTNTVSIRAVDSTGAQTARTITVNYVAGTNWPDSYSVDWSQISNIQSAVQVVDGQWRLTPAGVRTSSTGYDRLLAVGDWEWQDYDITVPVTVHAVHQPPYSFPANEPGVGFILRWQGHTESSPHQPGMQPRIGWNPLGAIGFYRYDESDPTAPGTANYTLVNGVTYMMKATVRTQPTGHRYQVKIWQEGQPESSAVFLLNTTRPLSEMAAGSALLVAHLADVTFGDITMINLAEAAGPAITNVQSQPGLNAATIEWVTSEPATGLVEYGLTSGYERGSVSLSEFATNHSVMLSGLAADTLYHFRIVASNAAGYTSSTGDLTFRTNASTSFRSDDFNGPGLDTSLWTLVDPVGDSTLSFDGAHALLGVPAGVDHSVWRSGNKSARLMQPAADEDLGVEVKFDSQPSGVYAQQGLIIEQDGGNFLRFDFYSSAMGLNLFAGSFVNGAPTKRLNTRIAGGTTLYMRVERQADVWALQYSYNGQAWTQAVSFTHVLNVSRVGVFVGNEGASPPAHTARIDHFFNTAAPIMPHD